MNEEVDTLVCQSCGMPLDDLKFFGTEKNGEKSHTYCIYCYKDGAFTEPDCTVEQMIAHNLKFLKEWNEGAGENLTEQEAEEQLKQYLPMLSRWK